MTTETSKTVKILRLESKCGMGVYAYYNTVELTNKLCDKQRHPTPDRDSKLVDSVKSAGINLLTDYFSVKSWMYFGFESKAQLQNWVYNNEWLIAMHKLKIYLAEVEVERHYVYLGNTQVIYNKNKVVGKQQYDILEYFGLDGRD